MPRPAQPPESIRLRSATLSVRPLPIPPPARPTNPRQQTAAASTPEAGGAGQDAELWIRRPQRKASLRARAARGEGGETVRGGADRSERRAGETVEQSAQRTGQLDSLDAGHASSSVSLLSQTDTLASSYAPQTSSSDITTLSHCSSSPSARSTSREVLPLPQAIPIASRPALHRRHSSVDSSPVPPALLLPTSSVPAMPASLPSSTRQRSFLAAVSAAPFSNLVAVSDAATSSGTIDNDTATRLPQRKVTTLTVGGGEPARVLRRKASATVRGRFGGAGGAREAPSALPSRQSVSRDRLRPSLSADIRAELPPSPAYPSRPFRTHAPLNPTTPLAASLPTPAAAIASLNRSSASSAADASTSSRPSLSRPSSSRSGLTESSSTSDSDSSKSALRTGMLKLKKSTASLRAALRSSSQKHDKAPPLPLQIPPSTSTFFSSDEKLVAPPLPTAKPSQPSTELLIPRQRPTSPTTPRHTRTRPRTSQQHTPSVSQDRSSRHCSRTLRRAASTSQIGCRLPLSPDVRPPSPPPLPRAARTQ